MFRGHVLSDSDQRHREQILALMTRWQVELESDAQVADVKQFLSSLLADGLVKIQGRSLQLTAAGRPFLRNACMALDERLRAKAPEAKVFSSAV
jgi:oxygen-independent coproporphyrinogen-3 oxidase